jgi:hypothetical protein
MRRLRFYALLLLPVALSDCTRIGERLGFREPVVPLFEGGPICPSSAVLSDAVSVTKLKGGAANPSNPADVVLTAEMSQAQLECKYDAKKQMLSVTARFSVRASRGAAAQAGAEPALDYFVAVVDADGNVLQKRILQTQPRLGANMTAEFTQNIANLPLALGMDRRPSDFEILTGFQLTAAELAYNRTPRPVPQIRR